VEELLLALATGLWVMFTAFVAGPGAVLLGGGPPIDGGRVGSNGQRLLGAGKTWRGLLAGIVAALLVGCLQLLALGATQAPLLSDFGFASVGLGFMGILLLLGVGSMAGDVLKSYIKRRLGRPRGAPLPLADQLDFLLGAWLLLALGAPWFLVGVIGWQHAVMLLLFTPGLHRLTNILGYLLGRKQEPW